MSGGQEGTCGVEEFVYISSDEENKNNKYRRYIKPKILFNGKVVTARQKEG
jgi:hypothetical protein